MSSFTTTILNLLFTEAEQKGKTRNFRMYIGPGSDKLSLYLKFTSRSMIPFENWYTCQSDVWIDDVKTFCVIVVHPYPLAQEDTTLFTDSPYLSCAKICIDDSRFSPDLHKDKRVTLNERQSAAFITETHQVHSRTIMCVVTPATEVRMMAVGLF